MGVFGTALAPKTKPPVSGGKKELFTSSFRFKVVHKLDRDALDFKKSRGKSPHIRPSIYPSYHP